MSGKREWEKEERSSLKKYAPRKSSRHLISKEWVGTASKDKSLHNACGGVAMLLIWYILVGVLTVLMSVSSEQVKSTARTSHPSPETIHGVRLILSELSTLKIL